ncbi:PVC-type heme-binding CxxCH protein [Haloferula sp. BvORR071]|uniref:PVC-type heme-binding CxxCH protein n=1 Tax=Haloferula sp. BvORR071 TaxID=1396141 RepID=UPI0009463A78|nr:PVC-type heme-binding CxxCH protein [Haloferula sp. BvORR071]
MRLRPILFLLLACGAATAAPKRILFLAGHDTHAWGQHRHGPGSTLLCDSIKEGGDVEAQVIREWPDAETLAKADALVIYADGWDQHPANDKLDELEAFMNSGKGLVALHWATGIQAQDPNSKEQAKDPRREKWRNLMGADFEAYYSISNFWNAKSSEHADHPVMRGVKPFSIFDECYFLLRETDHDHGQIQPLFRIFPNKELVEPGLSPYRGNDPARAVMEDEKHQHWDAWAYPRPKGGRAFGFTGGHFLWSWANDDARKMVLNGILWSAGVEIPEGGRVSKTPDAKRFLQGQEKQNPGWTEEALQYYLDRAKEGEVIQWGDYSNKPLPTPPVSLFDGKSLDGWEIRPGEEKWWKVQDGMITGGSLEEKVPFNTFLATKKRYENFELKLKVRLTQGEGFMNSGVQLRSRREADNSEMVGYQVDAGTGWWGKLYDESRRNKVVGEPLDAEAIKGAAKDWDWNEYRIRCEGPRIRSWINGVAALDYKEEDGMIPLEGLIGLQTHGGGKVLAQFKDITIQELPPTPNSPKWEDAFNRSAEREIATFKVPEGFEVELVASEKEGVGKPITMAWDHSGKMWTMTALEYPVDANENQAEAEALYARGGKDKVLVFDEPWKPGPQTPRVFADKLAIPLGILPYKNSVLVQHGTEIRRYTDLDKDGKADNYDVVLKGFGIQDSHLFPHQFERSPGGWFYLAQGLFNASKVQRPDGAAFSSGPTEIALNACKLARARLDGSDFGLLTAGPNNIWGFTTSARDGREFLQEANDLGHPVSEFIDGSHYPTGSKEKLKPYAPQVPESTPGQPMGGTGLSGLALAEDEGSAFAAMWPGKRVFYVANPITNRIQIVTLESDANGQPVYRKQQDFMESSDEWFRPVSIHFGPDGCLYIADWYNKIISHNEVPRNHPERDKTRGRIWRVKPKGFQPSAPVDLTKLATADLTGQLGSPNARIAQMAWEEIGDRADADVVPLLGELAGDDSQPLPKRLGALWAVREMRALNRELLLRLAADKNPNIRREVIEASGDARGIGGNLFLRTVVQAKEAGEDFGVSCALANALLYQKEPTTAMMAVIANMTPAPGAGGGRAAYEAEFLRYLIRRALEDHPLPAWTLFSGQETLTMEARRLCALALPPQDGALAMVSLLPSLVERPIDGDELALLGSQLSREPVAVAFGKQLESAANREGLLRSLLKLDPVAASNESLREAVGKATQAMIQQSPEKLPLALELARRFRLEQLGPMIRELALKETQPAELAALLKALNECGGADRDVFLKNLDSGDPAVAREALIGFASSGDPRCVMEIQDRWAKLPGAMRQFAVNGLISKKKSAVAFARKVAEGGFAGFDPAVVEKLAAVLGPDHPDFQAVLQKVDGLLVRAIRFPGKQDAVIPTKVVLDGPFTVETWVKLDPRIDNRDGLLGTRGGGADINFYDARLRLYSGAGDVVIADRPIEAGKWTHCAVTRDDAGKVALYLDGEPAGVSGGRFKAVMRDLDIGRANQPGGTAGSFLEYRIWSVARSAAEIRGEYRTRIPAGTAMPGLVQQISGEAPGMTPEGGASLEWTSDFPDLLTPAAAKTLGEKFERVRALANKPGTPAAGRQIFQATCMICHQVAGEGTAVGPNLSGAGAMGTESLLRNVLTPNAQLESGYYRHDIALEDGSFASGFLASEDKDMIVIRQIGADERAIPKRMVREHTVSKRSLMPEGLMDGLSEQQVSDLFSYLNSLK